MKKIMEKHNLKTKRKGVMKDIEDWINEKHKKEGDDDFDNFMNRSSHKDSRMSGQLAENVTEERLLRTRLFELGNERYKFLARFAFEKHQFQDKKVKRINAMKARVMSASSAPGRLTSSVSIQSLNANNRMGRQNGTQPVNIEQTKFPSRPIRPKTVHFMPSQTRSRKPESNVLKTSTPTGYHSSSRLSSSKTNKFSKFGGAIPGKTNDPRYAFLEKALSPAYVNGKTKDSVRNIVNNIESLHRLPGLGIHKVDIGAKIQDFMRDNQLTFASVVKKQMIAKRLVPKTAAVGAEL